MPIDEYGVLKARPLDRAHSSERHPHYQLHLKANGINYRAAIRARSMLTPPEMVYHLAFNLRHPITHHLARLDPGYHSVNSVPGGLAIDYVRSHLFPRQAMLSLPCTGPGCGDDLNEVLDAAFKSAIADPAAWVYVYGEPWHSQAPDHVFRFAPARGMHDVHMNQGNAPGHWEQDGTWQDGAVFIHHPNQDRWVGIFLKFHSQSWHTDSTTGHALTPQFFHEGDGIPIDRFGQPRPDGVVRIISARVRSNCHSDLPQETVTLLNLSPIAINLNGWALLNQDKQAWRLKGEIPPGGTHEICLGHSVPLSREDQGGIITLVNKRGVKIHGVSFTAEEACSEGWSIPFM